MTRHTVLCCSITVHEDVEPLWRVRKCILSFKPSGLYIYILHNTLLVVVLNC